MAGSPAPRTVVCFLFMAHSCYSLEECEAASKIPKVKAVGQPLEIAGGVRGAPGSYLPEMRIKPSSKHPSSQGRRGDRMEHKVPPVGQQEDGKFTRKGLFSGCQVRFLQLSYMRNGK